MVGWDDGSWLEENHELREEGRPWLGTEQKLCIREHTDNAEAGRRLCAWIPASGMRSQ